MVFHLNHDQHPFAISDDEFHLVPNFEKFEYDFFLISVFVISRKIIFFRVL